jgi:hypothetical protein
MSLRFPAFARQKDNALSRDGKRKEAADQCQIALPLSERVTTLIALVLAVGIKPEAGW